MANKDSKRDPPAWLNKDFFQTLLQRHRKQPNLEVTDSQSIAALGVGDNYASLVFRTSLTLKINGNEEKLSLICKTLSASETMQELSASFSIFEKEAGILIDIMPKINRLLVNLGNEEPLCAECIGYGKEPVEYLILQDLKELGFLLADRISGLDWNTTKLVLRNHARLHAGSLALLKQEPKALDSYRRHLWDLRVSDHVEKLVLTSLRNVIKVASTWSDLPTEYLNKIKAQESVVVKRMYEVVAFDEKSLNVLQHGDSWISNIMFTKGGDGQYKGLRFVDFQCSCLSPAAIDLNYFLFTSPKADIRVRKLNEALEYYHQVFTETVQKLGVELPQKFTLEDLKAEFLHRSYYGFIALIAIYPITITEVKNVVDVAEYFGDGDATLGVYKTELFKNTFMTALPYFIDNGTI